MNSTRYQRIKQVFELALETPADQRNSLLDRECDGDDELRSEVQSLLDHDSAPAVDIDDVPTSVSDALQSAAKAALDPERIGPFKIIRRLGEGGMGVVYLAEQDSPKRSVALKIIRPGLATEKVTRRFQREAHALARLQHPSIAQVYEAGVADTPQAWFAMEYVKGDRLLDYARKHDLGTTDRLELLASICDAVQHAHEHGVIHRDLKPANVLVDQSGNPKVLDFGIARLSAPDAPLTTLQTETGELIGTLAYMSPEQVSGSPDLVDARCDVYSLGVLGYELLSGKLPHDIEGRALPEAVREIAEHDPVPLASVARTFRGDLDTIINTALDRDLTRRYASPGDFAADIRRYIAREPLVARPPSTLYNLRKFAQRNTGLVASIAAIMLILLAGTGTSTAFAVGEARQSTLSQKRADELQKVTEFQSAMLKEIDASLMGIAILEDLREQAESRLAQRGVTEPTAADAMAGFDEAITGVNATDLALTILDEHVLQNSRQTVLEQFEDQPEVAAALNQTLADIYHDIGLYDKALDLQESALTLRTETLGEDHPRTLESRRQTGALLMDMGRYEDSESHFRQVLKRRRAAVGEDNTTTYASLRDLGAVLRWQAKYDQAEPILNESLEGLIRLEGPDSIETAATRINLGWLMNDTSRFTEAEPVLKAAAEGFAAVEGPDSQFALQSRALLAQTYLGMNRNEEALAELELVLEGYQRTLGEKHFATISILNRVGGTLGRLGRNDESLPMMIRSYELARQNLGEDHPSTIAATNNVAYIYYHMGEYDKTLEYSQAAVKGYRLVLGDDHPHTLTVIANLGNLLVTLERYDEAITNLTEVLAGRRIALGDDNPDTIATMNKLATATRGAGRLEESNALAEESVRRYRALDAAQPATLAEYIAEYARTLAAQTEFETAAPLFEESYQLSLEANGPDDDVTAKTVTSAIEMFDAWIMLSPSDDLDTQAQIWRDRQ